MEMTGKKIRLAVALSLFLHTAIHVSSGVLLRGVKDTLERLFIEGFGSDDKMYFLTKWAVSYVDFRWIPCLAALISLVFGIITIRKANFLEVAVWWSFCSLALIGLALLGFAQAWKFASW